MVLEMGAQRFGEVTPMTINLAHNLCCTDLPMSPTPQTFPLQSIPYHWP